MENENESDNKSKISDFKSEMNNTNTFLKTSQKSEI